MSSPKWNMKKKLVSVKYKINIQYPKKKTKNIYEEHLMKYFSLKEVQKLLTKNNLKLIKNLGQDFISTPSKNDWSVISISQKN